MEYLLFTGLKVLTLKAVRHTPLTCLCPHDVEGREEEEADEGGKHIRVDSEKVSNEELNDACTENVIQTVKMYEYPY